MMPRFPIVVSLLASQSLLPGLRAQEAGHELWIQDFAKAKAQAKAENKDLLVDFTGSDWCGWCIKLDKEVFSLEEFKSAAPKHFVLVKLDYPRNEELVTAEIREQNAKLQGEYSIQGYPTILLMDHDGRVYAQTGYEKGGPKSYVEMLDGMRERGAAFKTALAVALQKQGVDRAHALDDALHELEQEVVDNYHFDVMKEIVTLDADGKGGLKDKYDAKVKQLELDRQISAASSELNQLVSADMQKGEGAKALEKIEGVIKDPKNTMRHQMALFFKGMIIMDTSGDAKAAIAALEAGEKLSPESPIGKRIAEMLPEIKKQAEEKKGGETKEGGK